MSKTLYTSTGVPIDIGRELGKGGEGSVFEVPVLSNQVAKLYHKAPDSKKQAKLSFMASAVDAQLLDYVAWPQETLHLSRGGPIIGFLMPKVANKAPVHMVYSPAHRRQDYPKAAWDFLLYVARNIAACFDTVHAHGHVIGDVNQDSFMVGKDSKVVLIDSDSFQVNAKGTIHFCEVGVPLFTPPELQSLTSYAGYTRTANHDCFGLALLIFHVLFGGRHPFSGVPLRSGVGDSLEADIKAFRYAYARDNQSRGFSIPPRSIPISMLPDGMESMFHLAFTDMGATGARPSAKQWVSALDNLRGKLKKCSATAMHVYPDHITSCPWCALEKQGTVFFLDLGATAIHTASGFVLSRVWALIEAVPAPSPLVLPHPSDYNVQGSPLPKNISGTGAVVFYRLLVIGVTIALITAMPKLWFFVLVGGIFAFVKAGEVGASERLTEQQNRREAKNLAQQEYDRLVERVQKEAGPEGFRAKKVELVAMRKALESLPIEEKMELDRLQSTAQERQKKKFLEGCFIDNANISGVGPTRKAALRSFGIETAADVNKQAVMQVKGFGESLTRAVLDWKASCERRFHFNPATAVTPADKDAIRAKLSAKRISLEKSLSDGPGQLKLYQQRANSMLHQYKPLAEAAAQKLAQAEADFEMTN